MPRNGPLTFKEFIEPSMEDLDGGIVSYRRYNVSHRRYNVSHPRYNNYFLHHVEGNSYRTFPWSAAYQNKYPDEDAYLLRVITPIRDREVDVKTFLEQRGESGLTYEELLYRKGYLLMRHFLPDDQSDETLFQ